MSNASDFLAAMSKYSVSISTTMTEQLNAMDAEEIAILKGCVRTISYQTGHGFQHTLQGFGDQGILAGASAIDFDVRNRVIYELDGGGILLHAILDYHGGAGDAPLYKLGRTINLT